jgi:hypothetical protein
MLTLSETSSCFSYTSSRASSPGMFLAFAALRLMGYLIFFCADLHGLPSGAIKVTEL